MPTAVSPDKSGAKKAPTKKAAQAKKPAAPLHPDEYRMTLGEHLEELRMRLILSLIGMALAVTVCLIFGEKVVWYFCKPLVEALAANGLSPQVYMKEVSESFMVYIKISMITAAAFASPWMVYQIWQFVASGLYEHERKYITKYLPLSITLLITGMLFLYFVVLPLMLKFFVAFNIGIAIPFPKGTDAGAAVNQVIAMPIVQGDPPTLVPGTMYYDDLQHRLKFVIGTMENPEVRVIPYGSEGMVTPQITLETYIDMVVSMLLSFGLSFQMPLVVLALIRIGIFSVDQLKAMRRYVYFAISIIAAVIVPDVVGGMIALMIPLILLFEMGLWLGRDRNAPREKGTWKRHAKAMWQGLKARGLWNVFKWVGVTILSAVLIYLMTHKEKPHHNATTQPGTHPAAVAPVPVKPLTAPVVVPTTAASPATAPSTPSTQPTP